jgi:hypothetical protein
MIVPLITRLTVSKIDLSMSLTDFVLYNILKYKYSFPQYHFTLEIHYSVNIIKYGHSRILSTLAEQCMKGIGIAVFIFYYCQDIGLPYCLTFVTVSMLTSKSAYNNKF